MAKLSFTCIFLLILIFQVMSMAKQVVAERICEKLQEHNCKLAQCDKKCKKLKHRNERGECLSAGPKIGDYACFCCYDSI
ncbi:hypothetical protein L6164_001452 [Bauhinia variegata]|uniref:Uncharacterized protein n=1 Tax=Bauhinia variegata TaxID=167791 RepID=A0ACB9Q8W6_BAUVA|nr:hypothetical protein L6164_001452 [Bauhinia variegata]